MKYVQEDNPCRILLAKQVVPKLVRPGFILKNSMPEGKNSSMLSILFFALPFYYQVL